MRVGTFLTEMATKTFFIPSGAPFGLYFEGFLVTWCTLLGPRGAALWHFFRGPDSDETYGGGPRRCQWDGLAVPSGAAGSRKGSLLKAF